jgi:ADP-heptose:LPS heptosyltransferase
VAVLIKNAAALVSNCTGVSHIAAALKTKSIVISLDGEPDRWGPFEQKVAHDNRLDNNTPYRAGKRRSR